MKWYQNPIYIIALLVLIFPAGLYLMWKYTKWNKAAKWAITGFFGLIVIFGLASNPSKESATVDETQTSPIPTAQPVNTPSTSVVTTSLDHDSLQALSKSSPTQLINKTYEMTLFLEQAPTSTDAYFMTQEDPNDKETGLILCNMSSTDLQRLDGISAQNRELPSYHLQVTFTKYDDSYGWSYEANCKLAE